MLMDAQQRNQATDPSLSFIVQAPAGSGKTEILTQRYLRLLSTVSAPEQIVALTFTRKAASEMRERIVRALQDAKKNTQAQSPHQQKTLAFAAEALKRDAFFHWDLLLQPHRLRINTIDSLCQSINQAIPLIDKQIAYTKITDKAQRHYFNASQQCIQFALETPSYQQAIKTLLVHVDNRQDRLLNLFQGLLAQRDQWLTPLFQARTQEKSTFEQGLRFIEEHELALLRKSLPIPLAEELLYCVGELSRIENNPNSPRYLFQNWDNFQLINQELAKALCKVLLTTEGNFRKGFDHHVGLISTSCPPQEYKKLKNASKELLTALNDYPDFLKSLIQVSNLPNPEYNLEQWDVLQALFLLLPLLVGHLHVLFSQHNEVDFTTISQQALKALGDPLHPTDLALYLDHSVHHILVDEFQDTSITQYSLLTQLVSGWQQGDGKTLFIVGDPMQSIYRFRQAEVGLFFKAKEQGIGDVALQALELSCNFRSTKTLVTWVNQQFTKIFPKQIDIESGAVTYHPSINVIEQEEESFIQALQFKNREHEAQHLIQLIQYELNTHPKQNIAILVRSRSQLKVIISLLRQHQIPYQGTDITLLANLAHIRDVWCFTKALLAPANRLAWLAILRSPYCGLSLNDLHAIAQFNKKKSIYSALLQLSTIKNLSEEGRIRAQFMFKIMHQALQHRYESRLSSWVIDTLKKLHLASILTPNQLDDLEQFWNLLDQYEQEGRLNDEKEFLEELNKLYSQQATPSKLQIMTIHKSKGLEFDTVFLPSLGSEPNKGDKPMLRWLNLPTHQHNLLLMSPIQAAHQDHCPLYDYLGQIDKTKGNYEVQRLLYVAVTRAKSRLYLMDHSEKSSKNSFKSLLNNQNFQDQELINEILEKALLVPQNLRLPLHYYQANEPEPLVFTPQTTGLFLPSISRLIGIVTHQLLQWICDNHPCFEQISWNLVTYELKKLGFDTLMQKEALTNIKEQILRLYQDPIGAWIIAQHAKEQNEYELLVQQHAKTKTKIIDRTFEDQGKCWIIDFKTGKEDENSKEKYHQQLNEYGFYLRHSTSLSIHCGIYYLPNNLWISWQYEADPMLVI